MTVTNESVNPFDNCPVYPVPYIYYYHSIDICSTLDWWCRQV